MRRRFSFLILAVLILAVVVPILQAQMSGEKEPPEALISIYQVTPGKHLDFLRWQATQEAVRSEAGVPASQWYAHTNGASWDYIVIAPVLTDEQDKKVDEVSMKKGLKTGFKASLEFRQFISTHTDTFAVGPMTAADLVKAAEK